MLRYIGRMPLETYSLPVFIDEHYDTGKGRRRALFSEFIGNAQVYAKFNGAKGAIPAGIFLYRGLSHAMAGSSWGVVGIPYAPLYLGDQVSGAVFVYDGGLFLAVEESDFRSFERDPEAHVHFENMVIDAYQKYGVEKQNATLANPMNIPESLRIVNLDRTARIRAEIVDAQEMLSNLQTRLAAQVDTYKTLQAELLLLEESPPADSIPVITHPKVMNYCTVDGKLIFETEYIQGRATFDPHDDEYQEGQSDHDRDIYCGKFLVHVDLTKGATRMRYVRDAIRIYNLSRYEAGLLDSALIPHPHVVWGIMPFSEKLDTNSWEAATQPCLGSYEGVVMDCLETGNYESLVDHLILFLSNTNMLDEAADEGVTDFYDFANFTASNWDGYKLDSLYDVEKYQRKVVVHHHDEPEQEPEPEPEPATTNESTATTPSEEYRSSEEYRP